MRGPCYRRAMRGTAGVADRARAASVPFTIRPSRARCEHGPRIGTMAPQGLRDLLRFAARLGLACGWQLTAINLSSHARCSSSAHGTWIVYRELRASGREANRSPDRASATHGCSAPAYARGTILARETRIVEGLRPRVCAGQGKRFTPDKLGIAYVPNVIPRLAPPAPGANHQTSIRATCIRARVRACARGHGRAASGTRARLPPACLTFYARRSTRVDLRARRTSGTRACVCARCPSTSTSY